MLDFSSKLVKKIRHVKERCTVESFGAMVSMYIGYFYLARCLYFKMALEIKKEINLYQSIRTLSI